MKAKRTKQRRLKKVDPETLRSFCHAAGAAEAGVVAACKWLLSNLSDPAEFERAAEMLESKASVGYWRDLLRLHLRVLLQGVDELKRQEAHTDGVETLARHVAAKYDTRN